MAGGGGGDAHSIPIDIELKPPATTKSHNCRTCYSSRMFIDARKHGHLRRNQSYLCSCMQRVTCWGFFDNIMVIILRAVIFRREPLTGTLNSHDICNTI